MPLHLFILKEGLTSHRRLKGQTPIEWEGINTDLNHAISHCRYWMYLADDLKLEDMERRTDECTTPAPEQHFRLEIASFVEMAEHQRHVEYNVFTDGSKKDQLVGAGLIIIQQNKYRSKILPSGYLDGIPS